MMSPGTATGAGASIAGSSPPLPHQQYHPYDQAMYDQTMYDQTIYDRAIFDQAQHMSMSSSGATVPDYGQYRYAQASPTPVLSNHQVNGSGAYDSGVHDAIIGGHVHGSGAQGGHPIAHPYTSQDYSGHDDHFLRELRE
ncbi:hypothetical protein BCR41DRAFT_349183 [Lobosporangium transversale]|uniref:Uncharacterized protein n=1 Tax=Lobosporangium transversale TaxID=64571 RepID=A0A1Y2GU92_9FUNG|nr:hypothetical protein BCR41DRAFT_349183 [Lobosporangium transversale]ORZ23788.1 hypothetical protein BCR41DRAFT_349183 [Lobosporangium transversale]|eukprot:XP_021883602.1 hypothetical protein BCR41DRAFT_349183 [Lobosporangium transversale]